MSNQKITHENELLAMAPLNGIDDKNLFKNQRVYLVDGMQIRWDFILHNEIDYHFQQKFSHLKDESQLKEFKEFIRHTLREKSAR